MTATWLMMMMMMMVALAFKGGGWAKAERRGRRI